PNLIHHLLRSCGLRLGVSKVFLRLPQVLLLDCGLCLRALAESAGVKLFRASLAQRLFRLPGPEACLLRFLARSRQIGLRFLQPALGLLAVPLPLPLIFLLGSADPAIDSRFLRGRPHIPHALETARLWLTSQAARRLVPGECTKDSQNVPLRV